MLLGAATVIGLVSPLAHGSHSIDIVLEGHRPSRMAVDQFWPRRQRDGCIHHVVVLARSDAILMGAQHRIVIRRDLSTVDEPGVQGQTRVSKPTLWQHPLEHVAYFTIGFTTSFAVLFTRNAPLFTKVIHKMGTSLGICVLLGWFCPQVLSISCG